MSTIEERVAREPGDLKERVSTLIGSLGTSGWKVAETLQARGVTGWREDCTSCPVANLIKAEVPETVDLTQEDFGVTDEYVRLPGGERVDLPEPVAEFVRDFDGGRYLDLVDPDDFEEDA